MGRIDVGESVEKFLSSRRAGGCSWETLRWYDGRLRRFARWWNEQPEDEPTPDIMRRFVLHLQDQPDIRGTTVNTYVRALRAWANWSTEEGLLPTNPMRRVTLVKEDLHLPRILTENEVEKMLAQPRTKTEAGRRDFALMLTLLDCGCRISEALTARVTDLDIDGDSLVVRGKSRKERLLFFTSATREAIDLYLRRREKSKQEEYLFSRARGHGRLRSHIIQQRFRKYATDAGLDKSAPPHSWRRSFATLTHRAGASVGVIQQALGHSVITTTMKYIGIGPADMQELSRKFSPVATLRVGKRQQGRR